MNCSQMSIRACLETCSGQTHPKVNLGTPLSSPASISDSTSSPGKAWTWKALLPVVQAAQVPCSELTPDTELPHHPQEAARSTLQGQQRPDHTKSNSTAQTTQNTDTKLELPCLAELMLYLTDPPTPSLPDHDQS